MQAWRQFWCRHRTLEWERNIYGDEVYLTGYSRSLWRCLACAKLIGKKGMGPGDWGPELKVGQIVRPRFEDPSVDVLQAVVVAFTANSVVIQSITGHVSVKERRNIVPIDVEGPVYMPEWWEAPRG